MQWPTVRGVIASGVRTCALAARVSLALLTVGLAAAEQRLIIIGGTAAGNNNYQPYITTIEDLRASVSGDWTVDVYSYDNAVSGGHHLTRSNLEQLFTSLLRMKKGDKVLFAVVTHGAERGAGEKTHSVVLEDGVLWSLDRLSPLHEAFDKRGVQFAVIDFSCYSGVTQALQDDQDLCVITAATTSYVSASSEAKSLEFFDQGFVAGMNHENLHTLEDVFLYASYLNGRDYPQSSSLATPAHQFFEDFYLQNDPRGERRTPKLSDPNGSCPGCAAYDETEDLLRKFDKLTQLTDEPLLEPIRDQMRDALRAYAKVFWEVSKVAYQIKPRPGTPTIDTGYEDRSPQQLTALYQAYSNDLWLAGVRIYQLRAKFYYTFQTGSAAYSGRKALSRKNAACESFTVQ